LLLFVFVKVLGKLLLDWKICAIDGYSASGKTTLANQLALDLKGVEVVSMDDFFLPGERRRASVYAKNFDLDRLQMQVLEPLLAGKEVKYQPFDWANMVPSRNFIRIPRLSKVIIEGTYSLDLKLRHCYDFGIWVDTPESVRVTRKLDRGMSYEEATFDKSVEELTYTTALDPKSSATLVVRGASRFPSTSELLAELAERLEQPAQYTQRASG
jgi:uridine kinase